MNRIRPINISRKHKFFSWTNARTGSTHFTHMLELFGFESVDLDLTTLKLSNFQDKVRHNHTCSLFENHWDYKFIASVRNPYSMMISQSGIQSDKITPNKKELAKIRIENLIQSPFQADGCCECFHQRKPDYFIRLEHLYDDWLQLPFAKSHELHFPGHLKKLTETRMNNQLNTEGDYWKQFYDQSLADSVYYSQPDTFELCGYDRNSWKE
jgi:hypothetical protein